MQHRYEYLSKRVGDENAESFRLRHQVPLNAAPAPLLVLSHSGLKFLEVNDAAIVQYGFSREEFLKVSYPEIHLMPTDVAFHDLFDAVCKQDRRFSGMIWSHRLRDGRSIDVSVVVNSLIFDDQLAYILTPTDVSDFVKREREATAARNREEAILKAIPDLVFEIDLEGRIHGPHSGQREKLIAPERDCFQKLDISMLGTVEVAMTISEMRDPYTAGHERLDGSGYPRKLKGNEIILEARIVAVADAVEAMASHRPYRPGLGIEAALSEIEKGRGELYDSSVVQACLNVFRVHDFQLPR